jgi:hypothetical protein
MQGDATQTGAEQAALNQDYVLNGGRLLIR